MARALAECVEAMQRGVPALEHLRQRYPELEEELSPLLEVAGDLREQASETCREAPRPQLRLPPASPGVVGAARQRTGLIAATAVLLLAALTTGWALELRGGKQEALDRPPARVEEAVTPLRPEGAGAAAPDYVPAGQPETLPAFVLGPAPSSTLSGETQMPRLASGPAVPQRAPHLAAPPIIPAATAAPRERLAISPSPPPSPPTAAPAPAPSAPAPPSAVAPFPAAAGLDPPSIRPAVAPSPSPKIEDSEHGKGKSSDQRSGKGGELVKCEREKGPKNIEAARPEKEPKGRWVRSWRLAVRIGGS